MTKEPSNANQTGLPYFGFTLLLISAVIPMLLLSMVLWPTGGNDFGGNGMRLVAAGVVFILVSPATAALGLFLVHKHSGGKALHLFGWLIAMPTIAFSVLLVIGFALKLRPIPKYDAKNYQHLIGQNLRDAETELDTRGSITGFQSGGGVSQRILSLRGMKLFATPDGTITDVRKGYGK